MSNLLTNKGIQASVLAGGVLAICTAVAYSPALWVIWAAWAVVTVWALAEARRA